MNSIDVVLNIHSYWHIGSGHGNGPGADAVVVKTKAGLPFLPGKTLKGLLRQALEDAERANLWRAGSGVADRWFGSEGVSSDNPNNRTNQLDESRYRTTPGLVSVSSARVGETLEECNQWERWAQQNPSKREQFFAFLSSTSINDSGTVKPKSLRTIEVAIPCKLLATLTPHSSGNWHTELCEAAVFLTNFGTHRNRGLGRVTLEVR